MTEFDKSDAAFEALGPPPKPPTMEQHLSLAWGDFAASLGNWRMWLLLGINDIRQRYRRSRLGQFWIALAMATTIDEGRLRRIGPVSEVLAAYQAMV